MLKLIPNLPSRSPFRQSQYHFDMPLSLFRHLLMFCYVLSHSSSRFSQLSKKLWSWLLVCSFLRCSFASRLPSTRRYVHVHVCACTRARTHTQISFFLQHHSKIKQQWILSSFYFLSLFLFPFSLLVTFLIFLPFFSFSLYTFPCLLAYNEEKRFSEFSRPGNHVHLSPIQEKNGYR